MKSCLIYIIALFLFAEKSDANIKVCVEVNAVVPTVACVEKETECINPHMNFLAIDRIK